MGLDFIIIGAQKSGSTFLHQCLRKHPQIAMPENEVTIFEGHNFNEKSFNNYINSQINNKNNRLFGIKRPNLLCQSEFAVHGGSSSL